MLIPFKFQNKKEDNGSALPYQSILFMMLSCPHAHNHSEYRYKCPKFMLFHIYYLLWIVLVDKAAKEIVETLCNSAA